MGASLRISDEVRAVLRSAEIDATGVRLLTKLDPRTYRQVNTVLEAAGGKWNRKAGRHLFTGDPREALGLAVATGRVVNRQQVLQAFYTPPVLADRIAELAEVRPYGQHIAHSLLEPSAGHGALLDAVARRNGGCTSRAYDIDSEAVKVLRGKGYDWSYEADFLAVPPEPIFDRIVMNPPFTKCQDAYHVTHALKFLRPGGRLVAIMQTAVKDRLRPKEPATLCRQIMDRASHVEDVPYGMFVDCAGVPIVIIVVDGG